MSSSPRRGTLLETAVTWHVSLAALRTAEKGLRTAVQAACTAGGRDAHPSTLPPLMHAAVDAVQRQLAADMARSRIPHAMINARMREFEATAESVCHTTMHTQEQAYAAASSEVRQTLTLDAEALVRKHFAGVDERVQVLCEEMRQVATSGLVSAAQPQTLLSARTALYTGHADTLDALKETAVSEVVRRCVLQAFDMYREEPLLVTALQVASTAGPNDPLSPPPRMRSAAPRAPHSANGDAASSEARADVSESEDAAGDAADASCASTPTRKHPVSGLSGLIDGVVTNVTRSAERAASILMSRIMEADVELHAAAVQVSERALQQAATAAHAQSAASGEHLREVLAHAQAASAVADASVTVLRSAVVEVTSLVAGEPMLAALLADALPQDAPVSEDAGVAAQQVTGALLASLRGALAALSAERREREEQERRAHEAAAAAAERGSADLKAALEAAASSAAACAQAEALGKYAEARAVAAEARAAEAEESAHAAAAQNASSLARAAAAEAQVLEAREASKAAQERADEAEARSRTLTAQVATEAHAAGLELTHARAQLLALEAERARIDAELERLRADNATLTARAERAMADTEAVRAQLAEAEASAQRAVAESGAMARRMDAALLERSTALAESSQTSKLVMRLTQTLSAAAEREAALELRLLQETAGGGSAATAARQASLLSLQEVETLSNGCAADLSDTNTLLAALQREIAAPL